MSAGSTEAILMAIASLYAITAGATWVLARLALHGCRQIHARWATELAQRAGAGPVQFYSRVMPMGSTCAGYAVWMPGHQAVVLSLRHLLMLRPDQLEFLVAHELGHLVRGHSRNAFHACAWGLGLVIPQSKAERLRCEDEADAFAEQLVGHPRTVLDDPRRRPQPSPA